MDDEAFELPKAPHLGRPPLFQPVIEGPFSQISLSSQTILSRFIQKIGLIFKRNSETHEASLNGRIKELQTTADNLLFELLDFKHDIKEKVDSSLFSLVTTLLNPLIKEIGRIVPTIEKKDNKLQQIKILSHYVESIEKAKAWAKLGRVHKNKDQLEQAIIQQVAKEFLGRIDRDMQLIYDYLANSLSLLQLSNALKMELKDHLMPGVSLKIQELNRLKTLPLDFSLNSFILWRSSSDRAREIFFDDALHIIDRFLEPFFPLPQKEKECEYSADILRQLNDFDNRVGKLMMDIQNLGTLDENRRTACLSVLGSLEKEAHELNSNLRLSQANGERIEGFLETLLGLREDLSY